MTAVYIDGADLVIEDARSGNVSLWCERYPNPERALERHASYTREALWRLPLPQQWFTVKTGELGIVHVLRDGVEHRLYGAANEQDVTELSSEAPNEDVSGVVDYFDGRVLRGWLRGADPGLPLDVVLLANGQTIAQTPANGLRPDLKQAATGSNRCGFVLNLDKGRVSPRGSVLCVRSRQYAFVLKNGLIRTNRQGLSAFALAKLDARLLRIESILEAR